MKAKWSVLAVYEDAGARQLAMQFCDDLVGRFWSEFSFELNWCEWANLENPIAATEAKLHAGTADLMIMATAASGFLPANVRKWIEPTFHDRGEREGILVGLPTPQTGLSPEAAATQAYLRKLAHESGMDYLTAVPQSLPYRVPESPESYQLRATQVTSVLDTILHHSSLPPRIL